MKLEQAKQIAEEVKGWLEPYCKRIEIAGSIRRQKSEVNDVEILCIPKQPYLFGHYSDNVDQHISELIDAKLLSYRCNKKGQVVYGIKNKLLTHVASGFPLDIFITNEEWWPVALVVRTGPKASNIKIAMAAKKKGWKFRAYGSGFTIYNPCSGEQEKIICKSEREVFEAVGLEYLEPERR